MSSKSIAFSVVFFVALTGFSLTSICGAETPEVTTVDKAADSENTDLEIDELCAAAMETFTPVDEADLEAAKHKLLDRIGVLEKRLGQDGANGKAWTAYLKLDELKKSLDGKEKDSEANKKKLAKIQERFDSDYEGLNLIWFANARRALFQYRTVAAAIGNPEIKVGYKGLLGELPKQLEEYAKDPTATRADELGNVIAWMENIDQAKKLISAVREDYRQPNLFLGASQDLVAKGMFKDVDEVGPITDCILGMRIKGDGHTTGTITAELIPNGKDVVIRMLMKGETNSQNVGSRGPVRVYSDAVTTFTAEKLFLVNEKEIRSEPATCQAETNSTITGICATNGMRLVENIARKKVRQNHSRGDWIGARHAETRIARRFDEQAAENLAEANKRYTDRFRQPLWQRGLLPNKLLFATAATGIGIRAVQAEADQLAALGAPPELAGDPDIAIRLHESFVNNMADEALAGRTLNEEQVMQMLKESTGKVPEHFKAEEGEEPWSITFAQYQPIVVRFYEGKFTIKLSVDKFTRGDSDYPGMDITAHYEIVQSGDDFKAVRQGEVTILPPGFVVGKDKRLSVRQQALRELIGRRFDKAFRTEIPAEPLKMPERWKHVGELPLSHWRTENGWIIATWDLPSDKQSKDDSEESAQ